MSKIFISGGAGVIGRCLVKDLYELGHELFVGDLKEKPIEFNEFNINYWKGDLNNLKPKEIQDFAPDYFVHLAAAFERTEENFNFWKESFNNNVLLSNNLMTTIMSLNSLKKVVYASSYLIYDEDLYLSKKPKKPVKLNEQSPLNPRNLTGIAKLLHEKELDFIENKSPNKFDIASLRIFRGYGVGSRDIISRWARALINDQEIYVYNEANSFDYIFCQDASSAIVNVLFSDKATGKMNVSYGKSVKISEVIKIFEKKFPNAKILKKDVELPFENSIADLSRLRKVTGWKPENDIEKGISKIIDYEISKIG